MNLKPSFSKKLNKDGLSPMHLAVQNDHMLVVMWLIDVDRNLVRVKGKRGFTPLHYAAEKGNLNILREFYRGCPESIEDVTFQGDTVFHIAVKNHQKDAFELLLMNGLGGLHSKMPIFGKESSSTGKTREVLKMLLRCRARTDIEDLAVRQEAQTPRSRPLEWKLWRRRKWKSSEKRNIELVVDTLVATAVFQASLSPPGGLWQGTANADINSPMRVNNSSTTSAATSTHFTVYFVKYISVPSEPGVKPRRRRVKIRDRKEWW
ncbi:hypothetical protein GH714_038583 [Hevea brasiliensis]|uniref:PGG domain-containing protein n=1 Tax=Hevea brasiliensis TaxID=3981 RepID=A0A6A6N7J2_HEVBR|nr:hypothetical protein GH714_038583 [Hevea brasiliensis]